MPKSQVRSRQRLHSSISQNAVVASSAVPDQLRFHIEYVAPARLTPPARKLRKHSKRQLELIEASIRNHGFLDPLLVDEGHRIVCGFGRWLAATELGVDAVPVIKVEHLTPEQLRLYAIAENRLGDLSEFDLTELKLELTELENFNLDLELTGFAMSEIDDMVLSKETEPAEDREAELKIDAAAITRPGDLWQLGDHLLFCGNSLEAESFRTLMGGEKAAMVFTDPPYNVPASAISGKGKHKHANFQMAAGEQSSEEFTGFIRTYSQHLVDFSRDGSVHFQCMDWKHMSEMKAGAGAVYSELKNLIVWAKHSAGMGTFYRSQHELIFAWKAGTAAHINNFGLGETGRHRTNVWNYKGNAGFHKGRDSELAAHPTVKPMSLVADAIRDCSKRGDIILDPFGGFGTTAIAAERTGRKARLIELDPLYCDATIRRWQEFTLRDAVLAATGETFSEVIQERLSGLETEDDEDDFGSGFFPNTLMIASGRKRDVGQA